MDSVELERLERRACRRRQRRAENTDGGCQTLRMMEQIASIAGDRSALSEVTGAKRAVCSADYGDGSLRWGNGRQLRSSGGTYYWPDGRYARSSSGTWYYPDGRYARSSSGTWYYPDGRYAKSTNDRWYTASGSYLSSRGDAMLYVCQRRPDTCDGRRRGGAELADARLVGMLWRAG